MDVVLELGFDNVKYFESVAAGSASGFSIDPPARRLIFNNKHSSLNVFVRINNGSATTSTGPVPGDDIKVGPGCSFAMDFDSVNEVSFISEGGDAEVEGILGFKATQSC